MIKKTISFLAVLLVASVTVIAGEVDLENVKCIVAPRDAQVSKSADYKDAKVYFCCGGCAGKFAKDTKKYATKANQQLVSTKQYVQKSCPMSGGKAQFENCNHNRRQQGCVLLQRLQRQSRSGQGQRTA